MKNRITPTIMTAVMILFCSSTIVVAQSDNVVPSGFPELDEWVSKCKVERPNALAIRATTTANSTASIPGIQKTR